MSKSYGEQILEESRIEHEEELEHSQLIPLKGAGDERSDRIRSMSHVPSEKRSIAQKIAKLQGLPLEKLKDKISRLIADQNVSAAEIARILEFIKSEDLSPKLQLLLVDRLMRWHVLVHGPKKERW